MNENFAAMDTPSVAAHIALSMRNRAALLGELRKETRRVKGSSALVRRVKRLRPELEHLAFVLECQVKTGDWFGHIATDKDGCRVFPVDVWQRVADLAAPAAELAEELKARPGLPIAARRYCDLVTETARIASQTAGDLPKPTHAERCPYRATGGSRHV